MRMSALCILSLVLALAPVPVTSAAAAPQAEKAAVPAEEALLAARAAARAQLAERVAKAKTRKDFRELSRKVLEQADALRDDALACYATLLEARDLAVQGGDCKLGLEIVDRLDRSYAPLDRDAYRREVVLAIVRDPRLQPGEIPEVVSHGLQMLEESLVREEPRPAAELWEALRAPVKKTKDAEVAERHAAAEKELGCLQALARVAADPADGEARFVVGWHLAFAKDRMLEGIEHLAQASDAHEDLRRCARLDLANPQDAAARIELGDAWAAWAKTQEEAPRRLALERAESWYLLAHRQLGGLERGAVMEKLRRIAAQSAGAGSASGSRAVPAKNDPATAQVGEAVERALDWLARHQSPDGRWSASGFAHQCRRNDCGGPGKDLFDTGLTGLALLCFVRAGETEASPSGVVQKGLAYLAGIQRKSDGCFGERLGHHWVYGHASATIAMAEAYALTRDAALREPAQKAIDFVLAAQNPYAAWRYNYPPDGDNDASVTGWMVSALNSGRAAGLRTGPRSVLENALTFIDQLTSPESGRTGYTAIGQFPSRTPLTLSAYPPEKSEALTAVGVLVRLLGGRGLEGASRDEMIGKGAELLVRKLPAWEEGGSIDFYYWYYGTLAMRRVGGPHRDRWNLALRDALLENQHASEARDECGSWNPIDPWSSEGGRVYATALNCLSLLSCYRVMLTGH